jgi:hypothetical protein
MSIDQPEDLVQLTRGGGSAPAESPDGRYLYFQRGVALPEVWRMAVDGGDAIRVVATGRPSYYVPDVSGVFFFAPDHHLAFHESATGKATRLVALGNNHALTGLALSPDRRWLVYSRRDRAGSDIMLVENFP